MGSAGRSEKLKTGWLHTSRVRECRVLTFPSTPIPHHWPRQSKQALVTGSGCFWLRTARDPGGPSALCACLPVVAILWVPGSVEYTCVFRNFPGRRQCATDCPRTPSPAICLNLLCGRCFFFFFFFAVLMAEASSLVTLLIFDNLLQV